MSYENWESEKECLDKIYAYEWNNLMAYGLVKPCGILIQKCAVDPLFEALSGETSKRLFGGSGDAGGAVGTDAADVIQKALDSLASGDLAVIRAADYPLNKTVNVNKALTLHGVGVGTNIQVTAATDSFNAALNVKASDVELSNFQIEDIAQLGSPTKPLIVYPDASISNVLINRVKIKNSSYQGLVASSDYAIKNLMVNRVKIDHTAALNSGAGIVVGAGCSNATVQNCEIIESGHTGIDVWVCNPYIKILNNYIEKLTATDGGGIGISASEDGVAFGETYDVIVAGNKIVGPVEYNGIVAWTKSHSYLIRDNIIDGAHTNGVYIGVLDIGGSPFNWYGKKSSIIGNTIRNITGNGIRLIFDPADTALNGNIVSKNRISDVSGFGVDVYDGRDAEIEGNIIENAGLYGIQVIRFSEVEPSHVGIIGNQILYPMQVGPAPWFEDPPANTIPILAGIFLAGQNNRVIGNRITTDEETVNSIYELAYMGDNAIFGNDVDKPIKLLWSDSHTRVGGNVGFVTEASGVAHGASGMTVAHGLASGLYMGASVHLTPLNNTPHQVCYTIDDTNITIYHDAVGSQYIAWSVKFEVQP